MGEGLTRFQIVVLGVFGFFIVIAVLLFSLLKGPGNNNSVTITLWGTYPASMVNQAISAAAEQDLPVKFNYVEKDPNTLDQEFTESLAEGRSPDLVIMPQSLVEKERGKISNIGFDVVSERSFKDTFIDGAEVLISSKGIIGIPFSVDPLVMYWNKTLFANAGISEPPKTWNDVLVSAPKLSSYDQGGNVKQSAIALGSYSNINHAKDIIATLFLQLNIPIVGMLENDSLRANFSKNYSDGDTKDAESALSFYTVFSNAAKNTYSWNPSLRSSDQAFVEGNLAIYLGYGSELIPLKQRNPNLNFDIAPIPQSGGKDGKVTYGNFAVLVIPRQAQNVSASINGARELSGATISSAFSQASGLPPVRRDLLSKAPERAYTSTLYQSAIISRAWHDPSPTQSDSIFSSMIKSVTSGSNDPASALRATTVQLQDLISN